MQPLETTETPKFGKSMLNYFCMAPDYTNLNSRKNVVLEHESQHPLTITASCGSYPKVVREAAATFQKDFEAQPDVFVEFKQGSVLEEARVGVARILNAPVDECVFIKNATTGTFTVLQSLPYKPRDVIIYFTTTYGAIENAIMSLGETRAIRGRKIEYQFPITNEEIVAKFRNEVYAARKEGLNVILAIFDTIVSVPGVRFPFESLVHECRSEGILSLVDGAHSIGHMRMELDKLQPDFYVTDCHKWLNVPRGCAVLYVPARHQHLFRTTVPPSFGFIPITGPEETPLWLQQSGSKNSNPVSAFQTLFRLVPTADDTPYLCIPTALKFRQEICGGEERIYQYITSLARKGSDRMATILHTEVLQEPGLQPGEFSQMRNCGIATVRLPLAIGDHQVEATPYTPLKKEEGPGAVQYLSSTLAHKFGTWMPMLELNGWLWVRVSVQIFLEIDDFEWVAGVLNELCGKIGNREIDL